MVTSKGRPTPPRLPKGYRAETVAWFSTWASSEQAAEFAATDWQRLLMLAPLVDAYFAQPDRLLMAEIRASESKLGAMVEDRKRLRLKIEPPTPPAPPKKDRYAHISVEDL